MINSYMNNYKHTRTQNLIEDMLIQSIQMTGVDVVIFDKKISDVYDDFLNEDNIYDYDKGITIETYINEVNEFNGLGNQMSFFGLELKDKLTVSVSKKRYHQEHVHLHQLPPKENFMYRPLEGNLLYLNLNKSIYEIVRVNEDPEFLKSGRNYIWQIECELFNPHSEETDFNEELKDVDMNTDLVNNFESFMHQNVEAPIENHQDITQELNDLELDIDSPIFTQNN